jgi:hypothetical protein
VATWQAHAQAALGAKLETRTAIVITDVPAKASRLKTAPARSRTAPRVWDWWQVIAPVAIALCAIAQLAQSVR